MAKLIAVTGGKGGTGKSTIATALAVELGKNNRVILVDLDVDCPNDHLILNIKQKRIAYVKQMVPQINDKKCAKCYDCISACESNALLKIKDKPPVFLNEMCNGCNACYLACKSKAIKKKKKKIGQIMFGKAKGIHLLSGFMEVGHEEPTPIVKEVKKLALKKSKKYDFIIIDTSAGIHCNVIAALMDVDFTIAVTEPTPLGLHDLKLILMLLKELELKSGVFINKASIGNKKEIISFVKKTSSEIVGELPYSKSFIQDYSKGRTIKNSAIIELAKKISELK